MNQYMNAIHENMNESWAIHSEKMNEYGWALAESKRGRDSRSVDPRRNTEKFTTDSILHGPDCIFQRLRLLVLRTGGESFFDAFPCF